MSVNDRVVPSAIVDLVGERAPARHAGDRLGVVEQRDGLQRRAQHQHLAARLHQPCERAARAVSVVVLGGQPRRLWTDRHHARLDVAGERARPGPHPSRSGRSRGRPRRGADPTAAARPGTFRAPAAGPPACTRGRPTRRRPPACRSARAPPAAPAPPSRSRRPPSPALMRVWTMTMPRTPRRRRSAVRRERVTAACSPVRHQALAGEFGHHERGVGRRQDHVVLLELSSPSGVLFASAHRGRSSARTPRGRTVAGVDRRLALAERVQGGGIVLRQPYSASVAIRTITRAPATAAGRAREPAGRRVDRTDACWGRARAELGLEAREVVVHHL